MNLKVYRNSIARGIASARGHSLINFSRMTPKDTDQPFGMSVCGKCGRQAVVAYFGDEDIFKGGALQSDCPGEIDWIHNSGGQIEVIPPRVHEPFDRFGSMARDTATNAASVSSVSPPKPETSQEEVRFDSNGFPIPPVTPGNQSPNLRRNIQMALRGWEMFEAKFQGYDKPSNETRKKALAAWRQVTGFGLRWDQRNLYPEMQEFSESFPMTWEWLTRERTESKAEGGTQNDWIPEDVGMSEEEALKEEGLLEADSRS